MLRRVDSLNTPKPMTVSCTRGSLVLPVRDVQLTWEARVTDWLALKEAVLQVIGANAEAGLSVNQIVRAVKPQRCREPVTRDDVASVLKALVRVGKLELDGWPRAGGGGYCYRPARMRAPRKNAATSRPASSRLH